MAQDIKEQMREFLKERYGITTSAELQERIRQAPRINLAIFQEAKADDDHAGKRAGRAPCRAAAG